MLTNNPWGNRATNSRSTRSRSAGSRSTHSGSLSGGSTGDRQTHERSTSGAPDDKQPRLTASGRERLRQVLAAAGGARALALRRAAAVACVLVAGLLALQPAAGRASPKTTALVAAHDLPPGHAIAPDDVLVREIPGELLPRGALRDSASVRGRALNSGSRSGEVLTDARLAGQELAGGDDGRAAVPVRLADPAIAELLQPGQRVDIVTTDHDSGPGSVLAERAPVISVRPTGRGRGGGQLVVVRLPRQRASAVAAASLDRSVTVTLR